MLVTSSFYYFDLAKDVFIAVHFKTKVLGSVESVEEGVRNAAYPLIVFAAMTASVAAAEVGKGLGPSDLLCL